MAEAMSHGEEIAMQWSRLQGVPTTQKALDLVEKELRGTAVTEPSAMSAEVPRRALVREDHVERRMGTFSEADRRDAVWNIREVIIYHLNRFEEDANAVAEAAARLSEEVVSKSEKATIFRATTTWRELLDFSQGREKNVFDLSPVELCNFVANSRAPARAYNALTWLQLNLSLGLDLRLTRKPNRGQSKFGREESKAVAIEPSMLRSLDLSLKRAVAADDSRRSRALLGGWLLAFGCMRWRHVQRSSVVSFTDVAVTFYCTKGKQKKLRGGFFWTAPRMTSEGVDITSILLSSQAQGSLITTEKGFPMSMDTMLEVCRFELRGTVEDIAMLTSYSFRRASLSWAEVCGLDWSDRMSLGDWLDSSRGSREEAARNSMPTRYAATRLSTAATVKLAFVGHTRACSNARRWEDVDRATFAQYRASAQEAVSKASAARWTCPEAPQPRRFEVYERAFPPVPPLRVALGSESRSSRGDHDEDQVESNQRHRTAKRPLLEAGAQSSRASGSSEPPFVSPPVEDEEGSRSCDEVFDRWSDNSKRGGGASLILRFAGAEIWLGGEDDARNRDFIFEQKIGLIVCCIEHQVATHPGVKSTRFQIAYQPRRSQEWQGALLDVKEAIEKKQSVLVHCRAGRHRAAVAMALLTSHLTGRSFREASDLVSERRPIVEIRKAIDQSRWSGFTADVEREARDVTWSAAQIRWCMSGRLHVVNPMKPSITWCGIRTSGVEVGLKLAADVATSMDKTLCEKCFRGLGSFIRDYWARRLEEASLASATPKRKAAKK
jgi:hypothetical protein